MLKAKVPTGAGNKAMATSYRDGFPPMCDFISPLKLERSADQFTEFLKTNKWIIFFFFF